MIGFGSTKPHTFVRCHQIIFYSDQGDMFLVTLIDEGIETPRH